MPKATDWQHHGEKPKNDNDYFERMSRVIFMAGLNWRVLNNKWPGIKKAFANFDINKVAKFQEPEIEELMNNSDVIRNLLKIRAIIANAKIVQELAIEHGNFSNYLKQLEKDGEDNLIKSLSKQFAFLGKGTTVIFLYSVGIDLPLAHKKWLESHGK